MESSHVESVTPNSRVLVQESFIGYRLSSNNFCQAKNKFKIKLTFFEIE